MISPSYIVYWFLQYCFLSKCLGNFTIPITDVFLLNVLLIYKLKHGTPQTVFSLSFSDLKVGTFYWYKFFVQEFSNFLNPWGNIWLILNDTLRPGFHRNAEKRFYEGNPQNIDWLGFLKVQTA